MKIHCVPAGVLRANCYIIENGGKAVVVDPGDYEKINTALGKLKLDCQNVLLTHGHFDHAAGARDFQIQGAKIYCSSYDAEFLSEGSFARQCGVAFKPLAADENLTEGALKIDGLEFTVINTPGHTPGSVCLILDNVIFTGDTLFKMSIGRTDLSGGDYNALKESLAKILALKPNYEVRPGHGEATTLNDERQRNPYV